LELEYAAIIDASNIDIILKQIDALEKQVYPPKEYFILYFKEITPDMIDSILGPLNNTKKPWKIKNAAEGETPTSLIDEFYKTSSIHSRYSLVINNDIVPADFSKKLAKKVNKKYWIYNLQNFKLFHNLLSKYFKYGEIEEALVSLSLGDRIYSEYTITQ